MQGKKLMHFGLRWYFYTDKKGQNSWIPQDRKWLAQCTPFLVPNLRYNCRKIRLKCQVIAFSTNPTKWEELTNSKSEHAWCNCLHVCTAPKFETCADLPICGEMFTWHLSTCHPLDTVCTGLIISYLVEFTNFDLFLSV